MKYGVSLTLSQILAKLPKNRFELVEANIPDDEDVSYFQEFGVELQDLFGSNAKNPDSDVLNSLLPSAPGAETVVYVLFGGRGLYKEDLMEIISEEYIKNNLIPVKISRPSGANVGKKLIINVQGEEQQINASGFQEDYDTMMVGEGSILVCWVNEVDYMKNIQPAAAFRQFSKNVGSKYNIPKNILEYGIKPMVLKGSSRRKLRKTRKTRKRMVRKH